MVNRVLNSYRDVIVIIAIVLSLSKRNALVLSVLFYKTAGIRTL